MVKYYELTEQEMIDIRLELPQDIAFGFVSYEKHYFSSDTLDKIDQTHGRLFDLIIKSLFGKEREEFLTENESTSYEKRILRDQKNEDGEAAYKAMLGHIEGLGGIGSLLDTQSIPIYLELTNLRFMLKDGYFELALRFWFTDLKPLGFISQQVEDFAVPIMEGLCRKYGFSEERIIELETAPKGTL